MPRPSKGAHVLALVRERIGEPGKPLLQKELADMANVHWRTIQQAELTGKLSRRVASRISAITGVSADWLLADDSRHEMINASGAPWSKKDVQVIEQRRRDLPLGEKWIRQINALFCDQLLLDYYTGRSCLKATPDPWRALSLWRGYREKAWLEFLKEYPMAKAPDPQPRQQKEEISDSGIPERFEIIKQDVELAKELYPLRYGEPGEVKAFHEFIWDPTATAHLGDKVADTGADSLRNPMQWPEDPDTSYGAPTARSIMRRNRAKRKK